MAKRFFPVISENWILVRQSRVKFNHDVILKYSQNLSEENFQVQNTLNLLCHL